MNRYAGKDYKQPVTGGFVTRFAQVCSDKQETQTIKADSDFQDGYKRGTLRYAVASRHLKLINCGLDRFVEANSDVVWRRDGDNIIRIDNDLEWVDEYLKEENS